VRVLPSLVWPGAAGPGLPQPSFSIHALTPAASPLARPLWLNSSLRRLSPLWLNSGRRRAVPTSHWPWVSSH
jgi:hypothetical protein